MRTVGGELDMGKNQTKEGTEDNPHSTKHTRKQDKRNRPNGDPKQNQIEDTQNACNRQNK